MKGSMSFSFGVVNLFEFICLVSLGGALSVCRAKMGGTLSLVILMLLEFVG